MSKGLLLAALILSAAYAAQEGGKEARMETGKYTDEELKGRLTPLQFKVTRRNGTELPFTNEYWDNHEAGVYVDIISGEPLFSSTDKFDSGTGWPSFTRPIEDGKVVERSDSGSWMIRVEVRSKAADSHLGHVFEDGPAPTGRRYCINSASLRFIPAARLEAEGLGAYVRLFPGAKQTQVERALFAAGCFWHVEDALSKVKGVVSTRAGYTGGKTPRPSYDSVCSGMTGHAEAVEVEYDPSQVGFETLLDAFWELHNPASPSHAKPGYQYRAAVFHTTEMQREKAAASKAALEKSSGRTVTTRIEPVHEFWPAEDYHQKYYAKQRGEKVCPVR